jgi:hypothetical protein
MVGAESEQQPVIDDARVIDAVRVHDH